MDFFRYHRGELTGAERNSLEKEFQKDPFADEAAEGYSQLSQQEALKDLAELQKRIKRKTEVRSQFIVYRIAASIAILIAVSSIFMLINKGRQTKQLAENSIHTNKPDTIEIQPVAEPGFTEKKSKIHITKVEKKSDKTDTGVSGTNQGKSSIIIPEPVMTKDQRRDTISTIKITPSETQFEAARLSAPARAMSTDRSLALYSIKGKVISSEDNLPVPGASILIKGTKTAVITDIKGDFSISIPDSAGKTLVANYIGMNSKEFNIKPDTTVEVKLDPSLTALNEVVVVGYGVRNNAQDENETEIAHTHAQPATGKSKFDKYVQENLNRPDSITTGQRAVVVLTFLVKTDGSIDSIRIVRSPGKPFSDEAIRVLKSGPQWKPAQENGTAVEDEVRIRIVFR